MLILYETPAGYSIFKVNDTKKLQNTDSDDIYKEFFTNSNDALSLLKMVNFQPFTDTADAVVAATACQEGTVTKTLHNFLTKKVLTSSVGIGDDKKKNKKNKTTSTSSSNSIIDYELVVPDKALGIQLKDKIDNDKLKILHDTKTNELYRGIRCYINELMADAGILTNTASKDGSSSSSDGNNALKKMQLGLSHSLCRYKLKFSSDKVDTMIIQAIGLLDELDKEINTYSMRVKEWYGWHFPELQGIVNDNRIYCKLVVHIGYRQQYQQYEDYETTIFGNNNATTDDTVVDESLIATIKEAAEISMGTDITDMDLLNIRTLSENVLSMSEYRLQLFEYIKNRMNAIAPNLSILVGELVGARLISHGGSLLNLAKQPASTIQILGAEKALFRALKTKSNTPKYGLIYHASLIGQAPLKHKGKISRILAAKAALSIRVDALSDDTTTTTTNADGTTTSVPGAGTDTTVGFEGRAKVEARLRQLETGGAYTLIQPNAKNNNGNTNNGNINKNGLLTSKKTARYDPVAATTTIAQSSISKAGTASINDGLLQLDDDNDPGVDTNKKDKKNKKKRSLDSSVNDHTAEKDDEEDNNKEKKVKKKKKDKKEKKRKVDNDEDKDDDDDDDDNNKKQEKSTKKTKLLVDDEKVVEKTKHDVDADVDDEKKQKKNKKKDKKEKKK